LTDKNLAEVYREQHFPISSYPHVQIEKFWRDQENYLCIQYVSDFNRNLDWYHYRESEAGLYWW
jgi:hypothetical protein